MTESILKNLKPAKRYALALMETAESFDVQEIYDVMQFILNTINQNEELYTFLNSPVIKKEDKTAVLSEIFSKICMQTKTPLQNCVLNFLNLLIENNRFIILPEIVKCLQDDINESKNALRASITSVIELSENEKFALLDKLKQKTGKEILPEFSIDKNILGGIVIKINDTVIDLSVKKRIENLKTLKDRYER